MFAVRLARGPYDAPMCTRTGIRWIRNGRNLKRTSRVFSRTEREKINETIRYEVYCYVRPLIMRYRTRSLPPKSVRKHFTMAVFFFLYIMRVLRKTCAQKTRRTRSIEYYNVQQTLGVYVNTRTENWVNVAVFSSCSSVWSIKLTFSFGCKMHNLSCTLFIFADTYAAVTPFYKVPFGRRAINMCDSYARVHRTTLTRSL